MKSSMKTSIIAKIAGVISLGIIIALVTGACTSNSSSSPTPSAAARSTATPRPTPMHIPTATPAPESPPAITGVPILPDLDGDVGDLTQVVLYDLAWNEVAVDRDSDPAYRFDVDRGSSYILVADYSRGPALAAVTPSVTGLLEQDITIDSEVAMSLIIATEQAFEDFLPGSLSRPLDDLVADANQAVADLNAFYDDRNTNRDADRMADAIHALTMDHLNRSALIYTDDINEDMIRSYGGGLQGIRALEQMVNDPLPPLNPHFVFTRYNSRNEVDFGMSDLETTRWDFMGAEGMTPHITTGGDKVVYGGPTGTQIASI
ncbi:MAG: hypothetical protein V3R87_09195, partial [Dehalococcoidia bacterium]